MIAGARGRWRLPRWLDPPLPPVVFQLESTGLGLVRLTPDKATRRRVLAGFRRYDFDSPLGATQFPDRTREVETAIRVLLQSLPVREPKATLLLADQFVRTALIETDSLPRRQSDLRDMIVWRLKRLLPYPGEEARISHTVVRSDGRGKHQILAVAAHDRIVGWFERVCREARIHLGLIDLTTLSLANFCLRHPANGAGRRDTMFLSCAPGAFTILIFQGPRLAFYRCKEVAAGTIHDPQAYGDVLLRELAPTLEYYHAKMDGRGIGAGLLHQAIADPELPGKLLDESGVSFTPVDLHPHLDVPPAVAITEAEYAFLTPALAAALGE